MSFINVSDFPALPEPSGLIEYPAQPYEDAWVSSQDAYSEEQMLAYLATDRERRPCAVPEGFVLVPIEPTQATYGATEFGWIDWRPLMDGDKRLMAFLVGVFGNAHPAFTDLDSLIDRALCAAVSSPAVPAGFVLVPAEPTQTMLEAASDAGLAELEKCQHPKNGLMRPMYAAMIAAHQATTEQTK